MPPNLPTLMLPEIDFLWPVYFSLVAVLFVPRQGMAAYWAVIVVAGFFDQYRLQPQFYAIAVLMSACVWESWHNFARWFLVSTWLWAGLQNLFQVTGLGMHLSGWCSVRVLGGNRLPRWNCGDHCFDGVEHWHSRLGATALGHLWRHFDAFRNHRCFVSNFSGLE